MSDLEAGLVAYLLGGVMVAVVESRNPELELYSPVERVLSFIRATLAWPTYIAEDLLSRWDDDED